MSDQWVVDCHERQGAYPAAAMNATVGESLEEAVDTFFKLFVGICVLNMQSGFTMLEVGSVRAKNTLNIMLKNLLDACFGGLAWLVVGESIFQDGSHPFFALSSRSVLLNNRDKLSSEEMASFFVGLSFAITSTTIVSGAMAERTQVIAYMLTAVVVSSLLYPTVVRWVWNPNGWLHINNPDAFLGGMIDWSGSCVVHTLGGVVALMGAIVVGPRRGRFDSSGRLVPMPGSNAALQVLGTLVLWVSWYGFNVGGSGQIVPRPGHPFPSIAARVTVTTTLCSSAAGLSACTLDKLLGSRTWRVDRLCNGILTGLVSITAGCASITPLLSVATGVISTALVPPACSPLP